MTVDPPYLDPAGPDADPPIQTGFYDDRTNYYDPSRPYPPLPPSTPEPPPPPPPPPPGPPAPGPRPPPPPPPPNPPAAPPPAPPFVRTFDGPGFQSWVDTFRAAYGNNLDRSLSTATPLVITATDAEL